MNILASWNCFPLAVARRLAAECGAEIEYVWELAAPDSISFNHGLGEIVTALFAASLRLTALTEHDSVPWNPLGDGMVQDERGEWRLRERPERLAASYTLQAVKG